MSFFMKSNRSMDGLPKKDQKRLLEREARLRRSGEWGDWDIITFPPGSTGSGGWSACFTTAHRNRVFSVLDRIDYSGARHLAVSSLSGIRPTWHEMQRIKDEIAGPEKTGIEVYPPHTEIVDGADMFHLWVVPGPLPFGLCESK